METNNTEAALAEPLLLQEQHPEESVNEKTTTTTKVPSDGDHAAAQNEDNEDNNDNNNDPQQESQESEFCIKQELAEMAQLAIPLAISFFCRMGMASTDSSFVGHIHDGIHEPETYLAAAVLSDMVVILCITPPLAFNQVLNALVGQAMGSNNAPMAGIWLQQSMFWLALTMLPCLTGLWYVQPILEALGFPSEIAAVAGVYAKYNVIWPIPNGLYQCLRFYFQACGFPRPAMFNNLIFLGINAMLNWIFVMGGPFSYLPVTSKLHWKGLGFIGAAISLSISRTMQGVCYYAYMFVYKQHHKNAWPEAGWSLSHHTKDRTKEFMKQALPNIGTLLFQAAASQATTVLVGRLGELSIAASSALSTVTSPWSGTLSATCCTVSGVRVGYHLGRGNGKAAKQSAWLVIHFITMINIILAIFFLPLKHEILEFATDDHDVLEMAATLVPAMLVGTYLNLIVGNITSGVFSGQGRPLIATTLSFGLELPMSIGGVAIYILVFHGRLLGVYWWGAISGAIEAVIVLYLMVASNWQLCADDAQRRQETARSSNEDQEDDNNNNNSNDAVATNFLQDGNTGTDMETEDTTSDEDGESTTQQSPLIARV